MILPNKNIFLCNSLLGGGSELLIELVVPQTLSSLWEKAKYYDSIRTFEKFILILDLLYALNLVEFNEGIIRRIKL